MNINVYKAVLAALKAEGLEAIANIDLLLNTTAVSRSPSSIDEIVLQIKKLNSAEASITKLQQFFPPAAPPLPIAPPQQEKDSSGNTDE